MNDYKEFLKNKRIENIDYGFDVPNEKLCPELFNFQKDIVRWSLKKGKAAIFADTGLGKTLMQLLWANYIHKKTGGNILIVAPLCVSLQTKREGGIFNINTNLCRKQEDVLPGISITNYEMLDYFDENKFVGVCLDESSILKSYTGTTKKKLLEKFKNNKYKLACTATPSPNDHMEILNHAEYLGIMKSTEALAVWFINNTNEMGSYRLKNHARKDFWKWVSSWAVSISCPADYGYDNGDFSLPPLNIYTEMVDSDLSKDTNGMLFRVPELNATSFHREKRLTLPGRVQRVAEIIEGGNSVDQYLIWVDTNYEADALKKALPGAAEIRGSDKTEKKETGILNFIDGKTRILITKPSIFGFGLNLQNCHNMIFCGLSFSFEKYYQAVRRCWRYKQKSPVNVYIVIGESENNILSIVNQKQKKYDELKSELNTTINYYGGKKYKMEYKKEVKKTDHYEMILGDAVEEIKDIESESVHFEIYSPPFSQLYIYSDSYRDMGNNKNDEEFFTHYKMILSDLYRILKPGRLCAVHCKQLVNYKNRDGASGLRDFRGDIIRAHQEAGFQYHSEVCIWKDPVLEMQRTKSHGLLYKQLRKDASYSRQGLPDYLVLFRKWGEDLEPVNWKTKENYPLNKWQEYASPSWPFYSSGVMDYAFKTDLDTGVWGDIKQTNVLNCRIAREAKDEKHICPLQLGLIERAVDLWTNPNDVVFSPFAGIGSEGYQSLLMDRRFIGIELKGQYWKIACKNLDEAIASKKQNVFDFMKPGSEEPMLLGEKL